MVTGAAGFLGSHLCEALLRRGDEVVGLDSFTEYYGRELKESNLVAPLAEGLEFHEANLVRDDLDPLLGGADVIFHMAGHPYEVDCEIEKEPKLSTLIEEDLVATIRLVEACAQTEARRLILASSTQVSGARNVVKRGVRSRLSPLVASGIIKAAREQVAQLHTGDDGARAVCLRYTSVYGPRQRPDMVFARLVESALMEEKAMGIFPSHIDVVYVDDAIAATVIAADRGPRSVYTIAGGSFIPIATVIDLVGELVGRPPDVDEMQVVSSAANRQVDVAGARRALRLTKSTELIDGLERQVAARTAGGSLGD